MNNNDLNIDSLKGNPTETDIAALSAAISIWFNGLSQANPQNSNTSVNNSVDNSQGHVGIARAKSRNSNEIMGNRTTHSWTFIHRISSRK